MNQELQQSIYRNLLWFAAALVMAFFVWFVAKVEANPIEQESFSRVPIELRIGEDAIVTNNPSSTAQVYVTAQRSVLNLLTTDDIVVYADLTELDEGEHTVPLQVETARRASADTQPAQIRVEVQPLISERRPVEIVESSEPPPTFSHEVTEQDVFEAVVSGAPSAVDDVVRVVGNLDLEDERSNFERTLNLVALDANNRRVSDVTIEPRNVSITVDMMQRDDVKEVSVRPDIRLETLPENYIISGIDPEPRTVVLSGSPELLERIGDTVETEPISLVDQTGDFTVEVPLNLPSEGLFPLTETTITVEVFLSEQITSLQLQDIPVNLIGIADEYTAQINPETISVLLNGPVSQLEGITADDVQAVIDVNGRDAGTYDLSPTISVRQGQVTLPSRNITLLPPTISITLTAPSVEATPEVEVTPDVQPAD